MRHLLAVVLAASALCAPVARAEESVPPSVAEKGDSSVAANQDGLSAPQDPAKALELLRKSAEVRNAEARNADGINSLALAYQQGRGMTPDPVKARELFREAIAYGSKEVKHNLAVMLENGEGGPRDTDGARELFRQAAGDGVPNAMYRYAMRLYYDKAGGDYDARLGFYSLNSVYDKARAAGEEAVFGEIRSWLGKGVAAGDEHGVELLAPMTADGIGGGRDPVAALRLYRRMAAKSPAMKLDFARRLRSGNGLTADPAEARRLYTELVYLENSENALAALAEMIDLGEGGPKDPVKATAVIQEQADIGNRGAYRLLALRTLQGIGAKRDPAAARMLFSVAATGGDDSACGLLGLMHERGEGGPANLKTAIALYRIGMSRGDRISSGRFALLLRAGRGVPADPAAARMLLRDQYGFGDWDVELAYFEMLDRGEGGLKDPAEAARVLIRAAFSNRNPAAIALLRNPDGNMSAITRAVLVDRLIERKIAPANEKTGPLIGKDAEVKPEAAQAGQ